MATDRKAARQQRLRGAQTREPQDIEFAFTLPPPPPAPRATRGAATPSSTRGPRIIPTRGRGGSISATRSGSTRKRIGQNTPSEGRAEKRQRIDIPNNGARNESNAAAEDTPSFVGVAAKTLSPRRSRQAQENKTPEPEATEDELPSSINPIAHALSQSSATRLHAAEEVIESPRNAPGSGRRQPLSSDPVETRAARFNDSLQTPTKLSTPKAASSRKMRKSTGQSHGVPSPELDTTQGTASNATPGNKTQEEAEDETDELSPDQPRNGRDGRRHDGDEDDDEEAEEIPDADAARQLASRRRQRNSGREEAEMEREPPRPEVEAELAGNSSQQTLGKRNRGSSGNDRRQAKASPAQQRAPKTRPVAPSKSKPKPKSKPSTEAAAAASQSQPSGARRKGVVPVTAYRMTRHGSVSDSGDDILNRAIPFASRSGVNAVDVLAQACDEFAGSAVEALGQGVARVEEEGSSAERREYRTKLLAVEAFAEEARWKLMELTISLDAEYAVRKRVRAVVKEKGELRAELMRLRAEREQVALKMDTVRIQHEEEGKNNEELISLSTTLHDVALAASLGRDNTSANSDNSLSEAPLPILFEQIAALASKKSKEGGLLGRLKGFNEFLERVAGAIEGR